jgi:hypothetical protein
VLVAELRFNLGIVYAKIFISTSYKKNRRRCALL